MKRFLTKALVLMVLIALLGTALALVRTVVDDRVRYRDQALSSVSQSLAGPQTLSAGVLRVPFTEHWNTVEDLGKDGTRTVAESRSDVLTVLPEALEASGGLTPDVRRRGLFRVNGYAFAGDFSGRVRMPDEAAVRSQPGSRIVFGTPRLVFALGNARGLRSVAMQVDGTPVIVEPGTGMAGLPAGVSAPLHALPAPGTALRFQVKVELSGAQRLDIVPLGLESRATLNSAWPHPSFIGAFLPADRAVRSTGFDAAWRTSAVASNARTQWLERALASRNPAHGPDDYPLRRSGEGQEPPAALQRVEAFSVALIDPVDAYVMCDRATKYALLIICCTLAVFAVFETVKRLRVHPVQYLLVGFAMVLFFLLLLALSEHLGFMAAYGLASVACVGLITTYVCAALKSLWRGLAFGGLLATLYGALYGILSSEQNALLLGTGLLFVVLAGVMLLTRHADWDALLGTEPA